MAESRDHNEFEITVPEPTVRAVEKSQVTLPCELLCNICPVPMTIKLFKETECIYLYKNGQGIAGRKHQNRLSLQTSELENIFLNLNSFKNKDCGIYIYQIIYEGSTHEIAVDLLMKGSKCCTARGNKIEEYLTLETNEDKEEREKSASLLEEQLEKKIQKDKKRVEEPEGEGTSREENKKKKVKQEVRKKEELEQRVEQLENRIGQLEDNIQRMNQLVMRELKTIMETPGVALSGQTTDAQPNQEGQQGAASRE